MFRIRGPEPFNTSEISCLILHYSMVGSPPENYVHVKSDLFPKGPGFLHEKEVETTT